MSVRAKHYATIVTDYESNYACDIDLLRMQRVFLAEVDLWGQIIYLFKSEEEDNKWIIRIRTDDGQLSHHIGVRLKPIKISRFLANQC